MRFRSDENISEPVEHAGRRPFARDVGHRARDKDFRLTFFDVERCRAVFAFATDHISSLEPAAHDGAIILLHQALGHTFKDSDVRELIRAYRLAISEAGSPLRRGMGGSGAGMGFRRHEQEYFRQHRVEERMYTRIRTVNLQRGRLLSDGSVPVRLASGLVL